MDALGTNFWQLLSTQEVHWYQAWRRSSFEHPARSISIYILLIYYSFHSTSILDKQTVVYLWLCAMNSLGTNFWHYLSTQKVHLYQPWRRSLLEYLAMSIAIDIKLIYYSFHITSILEKQKGV